MEKHVPFQATLTLNSQRGIDEIFADATYDRASNVITIHSIQKRRAFITGMRV